MHRQHLCATLLGLAALLGAGTTLKHALFKANFTDGANVSDHGVLVDAAVAARLDGNQAREILKSERYVEDVREAEREWISAGIRSVPAVVINRKWLISGGQPVETFEQALRGIAAELVHPWPSPDRGLNSGGGGGLAQAEPGPSTDQAARNSSV